MKLKLFLFLFFSFNLIASTLQLDSLTLSKVERTVQMEEEIAKAYKEYLVDKGTVPTIDDLKNNDYLYKGFSSINPFGRTFSISTTDDYTIETNLPDKLKPNIYDYYYSSKYRKYTKEPLSTASNKVRIILDSKEKVIFENKDDITTNATGISGKYLLENGVLHWYNSGGYYQFSYNGDLIVDKNVTMVDADGNFDSDFDTATSGLRYVGQTIYQENDENTVEDYLVTDSGLILLDVQNNDVGETIIQFTRRAGGMIVNGDIYTWGNNANRITGINLDTYSQEDGTVVSSSTKDKYPVITTLVRAKVKTDYSYNNNFFSSPLRPKFIDFFSTVYAGTCGISTEGALYCGNTTGLDQSYGTTYVNTDTSRNGEMLYKSTYYDGVNNKAKKIFSNNQIWHILDEDGYLNIWGFDWSGFSGNGEAQYNATVVDGKYTNAEVLQPERISTVSGLRFQDITYMLTLDYRKIAALSVDGDIYIWGMEDNNSNGNCQESISGISDTFNLCTPTKITTENSTMTENLSFDSIKGGLESFIAKSGDDYYQIYQPKVSGIVQKIQVIKINDIISFDEATDGSIISVDQSRNLSLEPNSGIVWINEHNELKGDYYSPDNVGNTLFQSAISKISWKKIKVIDDNNGMCGIDIYNQMYCWGIMSYYRDGDGSYDKMGNTFVIPVFNTNLYDQTKDYMLAEGGLEGSVGNLTNITSGNWVTTNNGHSGAFFMKYPTYIGGFNYEFEFK